MKPPKIQMNHKCVNNKKCRDVVVVKGEKPQESDDEPDKR